MGSFGLAQLGCQAALEAKCGKLRRKFHDQYRIGKAPQRIGAVNAAGDEQKRQPRSQPQQEAENIGAPAFGQCCNIFLALVCGRIGIQGCCTSRT